MSNQRHFCFRGSGLLTAALLAGHPSLAYAQNPTNIDVESVIAALRYPQDDLVLVSSHRGVHHLIDGSNPGVPENSLESIRRAALAGLEQIELDVKLSRDGVPVLSHDLTWGRVAVYGPEDQYKFDPFQPEGNPFNELNNPPVDGIDASTLVLYRLRNSVDYALSDEYPSTLLRALDYISDNDIEMLVNLDIRDVTTANAVWKALGTKKDKKGRYWSSRIVFKVPFISVANAADLTANASTPGKMLFQPVFNTGDPSKNGGEFSLWQKLIPFFSANNIDIISVEVQIKERNSNLQEFISLARNRNVAKDVTSIAIFSPYKDYQKPDEVPLFYTTRGYCCSKLSDFYFKGSGNFPADKKDLRCDLRFILDQRINSVTRDDAGRFAGQLAAAGLRNTFKLTSLGRVTAPTVMGAPNDPGTDPDEVPACARTEPKTSTVSKEGLPEGRPLRVLIDGDSMTAGLEGDFTWRYRIKQWFDRQGIAVDFVGPFFGVRAAEKARPPLPPSKQPPAPTLDGPYGKVNGTSVRFDSLHSAKWGKPVTEGKTQIRNLVESFQPDLILVALGFNDVGWFYADDVGTRNSMKEYVDNARLANPNVRFVIADIPYRTTLGSWRQDLIDKTTRYDQALPSAIASWSTTQSPIGLAPFNRNYGCDPNATTCDSTYDGLHPNYKGDFRIASAFAEGMVNKFAWATEKTIPITGNTERPLDTPTGMQFDGTKQGLTATWTPVFGATSYDVQWREKAPNTSTWGDWTDASSGFARYDKGWQWDARPYVGYSYEVRARARYADEKVTPYSAAVGGIAAPQVSQSPGNVTAVPAPGRINVNWTKPTGAGSDSISEYGVWLYDRTTSAPAKTYSAAGGQNAYSLTDLVVGHHYDVLVEAWNSAGPSKPTSVYDITAQ